MGKQHWFSYLTVRVLGSSGPYFVLGMTIDRRY